MPNAKLQKSILQKTKLQGAILERAKLQGADLSDAKLLYADFSDAELDEYTKLPPRLLVSGENLAFGASGI